MKTNADYSLEYRDKLQDEINYWQEKLDSNPLNSYANAKWRYFTYLLTLFNKNAIPD